MPLDRLGSEAFLRTSRQPGGIRRAADFVADLFLSYPFVCQCRVLIAPVLVHGVGHQGKAVFYQHMGGGRVFHHGAGGDDLDIRFAEQIVQHDPQCLGGKTHAPEVLRKPVAYADLVDGVPESVKLSQTAEALVYKNAQDQGFPETLVVQPGDDRIRIGVFALEKERGQCPVNRRAAAHLPQSGGVLRCQGSQRHPLPTQDGESGEELLFHDFTVSDTPTRLENRNRCRD